VKPERREPKRTDENLYGIMRAYKQASCEGSLMQFQGLQGKSRIGEKRPKKASKNPRGPSSSSKAILGFFSLILAFPWSPWNCTKLP
jgi:hypothetical protein